MSRILSLTHLTARFVALGTVAGDGVGGLRTGRPLNEQDPELQVDCCHQHSSREHSDGLERFHLMHQPLKQHEIPHSKAARFVLDFHTNSY